MIAALPVFGKTRTKGDLFSRPVSSLCPLRRRVSDTDTFRARRLKRVNEAVKAPSQILAQLPHRQVTVRNFDFLVLGSGIAGLTYALKVADWGKVAVVTKKQAEEGCTLYAQGGIAAVLAETDSFEDHVYDTLVAGDFLNCREAVETVCREGPAEVLNLAELGAKFTRSQNGNLHLLKEGAHSSRRIVHADDATGREIERALIRTAATHKNIEFFEHHLAADLVTDQVLGRKHCVGADVLDQQSHLLTRFVAPVTVLATGGAGQVYPITTNPAVATGDGVAMAARADAKLGGMEFVQFHPTGFHIGKASASDRTFLISEAVRGEGGLLYSQSGHRFMPEYDSRLELAPRDVVARAIQDQMLKRGDSHVLLDISHCQRDHILAHFPNIAAQCQQHGLDITRDPIPVAPAAHYLCGGVSTGLWGETSVGGLYAVGEVAHTGLHGANRLASNSLLEGLVFASRAAASSLKHADHALQHAGRALHQATVHPPPSGCLRPVGSWEDSNDWVTAKRRELQALMWTSAGILRNVKDLTQALKQVTDVGLEAKAMLCSYGLGTDLLELQNLACVGRNILESALKRKESRGGHFVVDYPPEAEKTSPSKSNVIASLAKLKHKARPVCGENEIIGLVRGKSPLRPRPSMREIALKSQKENTD